MFPILYRLYIWSATDLISLLILFQFEFINWAGSHKLFLDYHVRTLSGVVRVRQFHVPESIEHVFATENMVELEQKFRIGAKLQLECTVRVKLGLKERTLLGWNHS